MKKAIVFVDANNWYHNVKKTLDPGEIDILKVANFLCEVKKYKLLQIRWYASIPSIKDGESVYYRHMSFLESLEKKGIKIITRKLQRYSNKEIIKKKRETIRKLNLCRNCRPIIESSFTDFSSVKKKEKGIDIWIAVDMIKKIIIEKLCDIVILISGDADFVPALNLITNQGKEALTAMTHQGYSSELRRKFPYFVLRKETLIRCKKKNVLPSTSKPDC